MNHIPLTAAALGAVFFDVGGANWYPVLASTTAAPTVSRPFRVIDGDTVVVAGTLDRDDRHRLDFGHHPHGQ